ncbi:MAG: hypothetical protein AAB839_00915 [Patescibacteria group bacterium]
MRLKYLFTKNGEAAYAAFRNFGLGISNENPSTVLCETFGDE